MVEAMDWARVVAMDWARVVAALPVVSSLLGQGSYALNSGSSRFCGVTKEVQSAACNDRYGGGRYCSTQ